MSEGSIFFLPVKDYCHRKLITCQTDDSVVAAAQVMRDRKISSLVVCDSYKKPIGVMTDRDLRSKVVAAGHDPSTLQVADVMTSPVISVGEEDTLFEVLYCMSRHRIHRVGVVDANDSLVGIINESDIVRLQDRSPQRLLRAIDEAQSIAELKNIHSESDQLIVFLYRSGIQAHQLVRLIALVNDQLSDKLITLLKQGRFASLGSHSAFLVLGSEGRREQTLKTDQDNAIIYANDIPPDELLVIEEFSQQVIAALIEIGVPECPGGIMARNPFWRRSLAEWQHAIDGWIAAPSSENILNFSMFSDMRSLCGNVTLEHELRAHIIQRAEENTIFLARMAANVCRFLPPLAMFGRIKTDKNPKYAGQLDLKKAGIFALTEGVKTLALSHGIMGGSTHDKLMLMRDHGHITVQQFDDIDASFNLLMFLRMRGQVDAMTNGRDISNHIYPGALNRIEQGRLRQALEVVKSFQSYLKQAFQLDMLRN